MFSPDGKTLVFSSNRANPPGARDTDVYLADWVP
jgi:Tol biopolymer transport system component